MLRRWGNLGRMTGIHEDAPWAVGVGLRVHAMKKRDFIGMTSEMGKHGTDQLARLALRRERPGTAHEISIAPWNERKSSSPGRGVPVMLFESRFVFPQIDVEAAPAKFEAPGPWPCGGFAHCLAARVELPERGCPWP